jgi:hypothetical protein
MRQAEPIYPVVDLAAAAKRARKLRDVLCIPANFGVICDGEMLDRLTTATLQAFETTTRPLPPVTVRASMTPLLGRSIDFDVLSKHCAFLACNYERMASGETVTPGMGVPTGPVLVRFLGGQWVTDGKSRNVRYEAEIIWGPWYGRRMSRMFAANDPGLNYMLYRLKILRKRKPPLLPVTDVAGLIAWAQPRATPQGWTFGQVRLNGYCEGRNQKVLKELIDAAVQRTRLRLSRGKPVHESGQGCSPCVPAVVAAGVPAAGEAGAVR